MQGSSRLDKLLCNIDTDFSCFAGVAATPPGDYYLEGQGSLMQCVLTPPTQHMPISTEDIAAHMHQQVGCPWVCLQGHRFCTASQKRLLGFATFGRIAVAVAHATVTLRACTKDCWQVAVMPCKARASAVSMGVETVHISTRIGITMAQHSQHWSKSVLGRCTHTCVEA